MIHFPTVESIAIAIVVDLAPRSRFTGIDSSYRDLCDAIRGADDDRAIRALMADFFEYGRPGHECVW